MSEKGIISNLEAGDILIAARFPFTKGVLWTGNYGNEVDKIISRKPPFIIRSGTVFFFILLLLIGSVSLIIQLS